MPSVEFSVIIVNFNGGDYLQKAIDSLAGQTNRQFEVIVLDNNSADGSMDGLDTSGLPHVQILRESENHGFAKGNNLAAEKARGRWLVLLNPDAAATPDWLSKLGDAARQYPDCRVFACTQLDMHSEGILDGTGDAYLVFGFPWRGSFGKPRPALPPTGLCFSPCGAAAMYDRDVFLKHGGFDERFFCYCEDVDLGFRFQREGLACIFVHDAVVEHAGSAISGSISGFAAYHGTRNRIWTYFKNMPGLALWPTLPGHALLSLYLILRGLLNGTFVPVLRGTWHGFRDLPRILSDRRWRSDRSLSVWALTRTMAWNPLRLSLRQPHIRPIPHTAAPAEADAPQEAGLQHRN
ncbi:glycosyltransferase family 2 protein [Hyphomonas adhaerens]|uniref:glycosyltransferase family 2 protein n=1 Tax=Hyphomonas adhaerens TaxID=81029 RepID=UPI002352D217|nr:glycosyltransferase family 2 protein [Hyphomonas adhaerens]